MITRLLFLAIIAFLFASPLQAQYNTYASEYCTTLNERWKVCWRTLPDDGDGDEDTGPYLIDLQKGEKARIDKALRSLSRETEDKPKTTDAGTSDTNYVTFSGTTATLGTGTVISNAGTVLSLIGDEGSGKLSFVSTGEGQRQLVLPSSAPVEPKPCRGYMIMADGHRIDLCHGPTVGRN